MRHFTGLAVVAALAFSLGTANAATYSPDPSHTTVRATWNHVGFSDQSLNFRGVTGTVELDQGNIASTKVNISIDLASVDSGVPALDTHLQSGDFLSVGDAATATFVSTSVEQTGDKTAKVTGDLTLRGVTKPVTLDVTLNNIGPHPLGQFMEFYQGDWIGVTATGVVKRSDWGMGMMVPAVSDEVTIFISTEMKAQ